MRPSQGEASSARMLSTSASLDSLQASFQRRPPIQLGRSSASDLFKEESSGGKPIPGARSCSPRSLGCRSCSPGALATPGRRTIFSAYMTSGHDMHQVLAYCPSEMRRVNSVPPNLHGRSRKDETGDCQSLRSWSLSMRHNDESPTPGISTPARSPSPSQPKRFISAPWDSRQHNRAESVTSPVSEASTRSTATVHSERSFETSQAPRVRGPGVAISQRGRSSAGIPWRQVPVHSPTGTMTITGDTLGTSKARQLEMGLPRRHQSQFSSKLSGSPAVHDVLEPVLEHRKSSPQQSLTEKVAGTAGATSVQLSPRQAWIEVVKRRQELKYDRYCDARASGHSACREGAQEKGKLHWAYRPRRKQVRDGNSNTKDSCPFSRTDSSPGSRAVQSPTPHKRDDRSPPPHLRGSGACPAAMQSEETPNHRDYTPAERSGEARRGNFRFLRERLANGEDRQRSPMASVQSCASGSSGVCASAKSPAVQGTAAAAAAAAAEKVPAAADVAASAAAAAQAAQPTLLTAGARQPLCQK
eukprot:CAMPEP_0115239530 /NCGR_PEP_ID=MMETSP0270-20121206/37448_1 /TAXON_ID=71861 /ORGANISM="Scrippsiella trochoidea, Strain CCMP3099" /LENGTH=528 /DNA_ID=CAMNT_0002654495 /DNA_START=27 /DNA_END=1613 /DNA_ORIENTATION=+